MKRNTFLRYWPVTVLLGGIALFAVLVASTASAQAVAEDRSPALQETPPVVTVPAVTVIVPETGGDTIIVDFFSNWILWAVLGLLVIVLLIGLLARPRGPETHHHHDV